MRNKSDSAGFCATIGAFLRAFMRIYCLHTSKLPDVQRAGLEKQRKSRYSRRLDLALERMTTFLLIVFLWIFSVCLHEYAHAIVAFYGGDKSVVEKGYLSLNPMNYLDPMTSVLIPTLVLVMGGLGLPGAAVYIDTAALRSRQWESLVSLAGPAMNLLILIVVAVIFHSFGFSGTPLGAALAFFALLQASAIVLNLLPIPGFDGFGAIEPYLPDELRYNARRAAPFMMLGLLLVLFTVPGASRLIMTACFTITSIFGISPYEIVEGLGAFRFWKQ